MRKTSRIDELILQDVAEHPGTSHGEVVQRMYRHGYSSGTYIRDCIRRLVAQGYLSSTQQKMRYSLNIPVLSQK